MEKRRQGPHLPTPGYTVWAWPTVSTGQTLRKYQQKKNKGKIVVYEAGVGTGFSCEKFLEFKNAKVYGCDIIIDDRVKDAEDKVKDFFENLSRGVDEVKTSIGE